MRIPSFYCHFCLYPLVWRVSEEASYDNVWLYLIEFDHQVAEGVDKDTEDEEEPQLSLAFEKPIELIASLFQVSSEVHHLRRDIICQTICGHCECHSNCVRFETSTFECFERDVLLSIHFARLPKWRNPPGPSLKLSRGTPQKSRRIPASRSSWCLYKLLGSSGCLLWCLKVWTEVKYAATRKENLSTRVILETFDTSNCVDLDLQVLCFLLISRKYLVYNCCL